MNFPKLLGRYTKTFPITLFRLQPQKEVKLREFIRQQEKDLTYFDFRLMNDGLIHPQSTEYFVFPNGMSMRPTGKKLENFLKSFRGKCIYMVKEGTKIPDNLVLLHEHTDHYSLQTSVPCKEDELNERLTKFLTENATFLTKMECLDVLKKQK
jgi:hypothetical protein